MRIWSRYNSTVLATVLTCMAAVFLWVLALSADGGEHLESAIFLTLLAAGVVFYGRSVPKG